MNLLEFVNEQKILTLALETVSKAKQENEDDEDQTIAMSIIAFFATKNILSKKESFTEQDVYDEIQAMIVEHVLSSLVNKNLVDYDFETGKYSLNENGLKESEKILNKRKNEN